MVFGAHPDNLPIIASLSWLPLHRFCPSKEHSQASEIFMQIPLVAVILLLGGGGGEGAGLHEILTEGQEPRSPPENKNILPCPYLQSYSTASGL